ncbi:MAG: DegV family protein [Anaerolineales bacterium]|nr:DegV family protein [Anaerolineales bacterium]
MSKHRIALMTDSTCDIPDNLIGQYDITVIPCYVIWDNQEFRDHIDLSAVDFYERLVSDPHYPSTAHPSFETFRETYERAAKQGAEEIVMITVSSAMSGTYQAALQAASEADIPVHVVDSRGPTLSLGWQVLAAARAREAFGAVPSMLAAAQKARERMVQFVCMHSIEYLHKGGRIGNATHFFGNILNIKPIIYIDHNSGLVEGYKKIRTFSRAVEVFYQGFFKTLGDLNGKKLHIAVLHGNAPREAEQLAERVRREYNPAELLINCTGPVLGVNTGPGALALCGYLEE